MTHEQELEFSDKWLVLALSFMHRKQWFEAQRALGKVRDIVQGHCEEEVNQVEARVVEGHHGG